MTGGCTGHRLSSSYLSKLATKGVGGLGGGKEQFGWWLCGGGVVIGGLWRRGASRCWGLA